ncbi:hypothetical protein WMY93_009147 [Mugilogobius chulae]|uniref:Cystine/glutamate transporter n=1 Tax=Mugilogobius chulae TaxID=88201 RepID=A0AAW0PJU3_9GOBI
MCIRNTASVGLKMKKTLSPQIRTEADIKFVLEKESFLKVSRQTLYTNCCTSSHDSVKLIKFADDTTLIGLISDGDESVYRREVDRLVSWCSSNNLELNAQKTVEMIVDFRKVTALSPPLALTDSPITTVDSIRFLGTTITQDLKWEPSISSLIKKAQQRMYFLRQLKKAKLPAQMMVQFYTSIIESILTSSITVWYAGATVRDRHRLQRIVRSAEKVIGCSLPSLQDLYVSRTRGRAGRIAADPSHPGHRLFEPLPSGRRLRSIRTRTSRHKNSFFPSAEHRLREAERRSGTEELSGFTMSLRSSSSSSAAAAAANAQHNGSSGHHHGPQSRVELGKKVTLLRGVAIIIGTIIGAGIFISPKGIVKHSGSIGVSLLVWVACGLLSLFGALCYAELGTCIQKSGGHYTYILEAFGPQMAFIRLWVELIALRPAAIAVISLAFGQYILEPIFMPCAVPTLAVKLATTMGITAVMYLNAMSVTWSARVQIVLTCSKLLAIVIIVVPGIYRLLTGETSNFVNAFDTSRIQLSGMPLAFYSGMYAYAGWFYLNFVTEEIENPEKTLPLAICISMAVVTSCYVLTNVAYFSVMSVEELLASDAVAVTFAERVFGSFSVAVPVFVALSCFGAMNGSLFALARMFYVASREQQLPAVLSMIHVRRHTPLPAVFALYPVTVLQLFVGDIHGLLNFMSFMRWLFIGVVVLGLLYLRYTQPDLPRPFKVPLFIPVLFCLTCFFMVFLSLFSDPLNTGIGFAISLTGLPAYYVFIHYKHRPKWLQRGFDTASRVLQIVLEVVPTD